MLNLKNWLYKLNTVKVLFNCLLLTCEDQAQIRQSNFNNQIQIVQLACFQSFKRTIQDFIVYWLLFIQLVRHLNVALLYPAFILNARCIFWNLASKCLSYHTHSVLFWAHRLQNWAHSLAVCVQKCPHQWSIKLGLCVNILFLKHIFVYLCIWEHLLSCSISWLSNTHL